MEGIVVLEGIVVIVFLPAIKKKWSITVCFGIAWRPCIYLKYRKYLEVDVLEANLYERI